MQKLPNRVNVLKPTADHIVQSLGLKVSYISPCIDCDCLHVL